MNSIPRGLKLGAILQKLEKLETEVAALRAKSEGPFERRQRQADQAELASVTDRRGMLKKVAGLTIGAATVGLLRPNSAKAGYAAPDATGGNFILGQQNDANVTTSLDNSTTTLLGTQFLVENHGTGNFAQPAGTSIAIVGYTNSAGGSTSNDDFIGVYGEAHGANVNIGVEGISDLFGVRGIAPIAIVGNGSGTGSVGGMFLGNRAAINLVIGGGAAADPNFTPPSGADQGDLYRGTTNGSLWYRTNASVDPFQRLADATTAGALSLLSAPLRLVDTRTGSGFFDAGNHYSNDTLRIYNIVTLAAGMVPAGIRAIVGRVTAVNATAGGGLQESPNPPTSGNDLGQGTAIINFAAGQVIGATFISALDANKQIRIHSVIAGTVDVIIDIVGYFY